MKLLFGWLTALLSVIAFCTTHMASAHETRPAVAEITVGQSEVAVTIDLPLEPLLAGIDLGGVSDTDEAPEASEHDRLRALAPNDLSQLLYDVWPEMSEQIRIMSGSTRLDPSLISVRVPEIGDRELPRDSSMTFRAMLPFEQNPVTFSWDQRMGDVIVRDTDGGYAALLRGGEESAPLPRLGQSAVETPLSTFARYTVIGFQHILPKGMDHILFVLGLFFFSTSLSALLWQVTGFTVAHSVTLALSVFGVFSLPSQIVEPLIALSIVFIAVENLTTTQLTWRRPVVVFAFGLLHGLGFASILKDVGLPPQQELLGLVAFNVGVEAGQLAVIGAAFATVGYWFGNRPWYRARIAIPASILIGLTGAWWFLERVGLIG